MPPKKARIKDIAKLAGVSIGTVDRVIHQRGEVAEETFLKVQKILKETNYSPNLMAQVLKSKKKFSIVSLLPEPTEDNPFWKKHPEGLKRALDEYPFPIDLTQITFDMMSEKDFQNKSSLIFDLQPDAVILVPIFKSETKTFASRLAKEKISLVFIDGFIEEIEFLAYIGENIFRSGRVAGQLIDLVTPEKSDILIVTIAKNPRNVHHLETRAQGFISYFKGECNNRGKKISVNIPDPSFKSISVAMDNAFRKNPGIASIFLTGSRSFLMAKYLVNKDLNQINLVGYDLLDENVVQLRKGNIRFLINQRPEEQTYKAVRNLIEFLVRHKVPDRMEYLPVDIVTSENVDFFI